MVRCVGKVERFGPKTKFDPLRKAKLAIQTRIHVTECRAVPKRPVAGAPKSVLSYH